MANNERVAAAAHLHVALRRKAGRVTDTDWMAVNDDYAHAIVGFARDQAQEQGDASLEELANRLESLLNTGAQSKPAAAPLVQRVSASLRAESLPTVAEEGPAVSAEADSRYIGGLR